MNENIDFVGSNEPLTGDVAIYGALFDDFLQDHIAKGQINPEITNPILKAYNVGSEPCIMSALAEAFVAGINAGLSLAVELGTAGKVAENL